MQKAVALLLLLATSSLASVQGPTITSLNTYKHSSDVDLDLCPICINFADEFINDLLNIILNAGVIGGCADLCQLLEEKVHSQLAEVVCDLLCDYVGIEEFINIINHADLDPIYYCELLHACPIDDNGDAHITSLKVIPDKVPHGSKFHIVMLFDTVNGTGTGEIDLLINTVDGVPVGDNELSEPLKPGAYNVTWSVDAKRDPHCDPTQQICEEWLPGNYTANVAICNGECGSKHPHSKVYDQAKAPFTVTKG